jgi:hypothetical protein
MPDILSASHGPRQALPQHQRDTAKGSGSVVLTNLEAQGRCRTSSLCFAGAIEGLPVGERKVSQSAAGVTTEDGEAFVVRSNGTAAQQARMCAATLSHGVHLAFVMSGDADGQPPAGWQTCTPLAACEREEDPGLRVGGAQVCNSLVPGGLRPPRTHLCVATLPSAPLLSQIRVCNLQRVVLGQTLSRFNKSCNHTLTRRLQGDSVCRLHSYMPPLTSTNALLLVRGVTQICNWP